MIQVRANELTENVNYGLKNLEKLKNLSATIDDGKLIQDFMIQILGVHPEKIHLLATEADANQIIKRVRFGDEDSKDKIFYEEAKSDVQRKAWLSKPLYNVPDHLLPPIKASFLCYSKGIQDELLELV